MEAQVQPARTGGFSRGGEMISLSERFKISQEGTASFHRPSLKSWCEDGNKNPTKI